MTAARHGEPNSRERLTPSRSATSAAGDLGLQALSVSRRWMVDQVDLGERPGRGRGGLGEVPDPRLSAGCRWGTAGGDSARMGRL